MRLLHLLLFGILFCSFEKKPTKETSWIRINHLGYQPNGVKVAIWCSKEISSAKTFELVESSTNKIVFTAKAGKTFGAYGPFKQTQRLNFSSFKKPGKYYLRTGETRSPEFSINKNVYDGAADFCLRYMRQQRSGFNPFLKDSCHTQDGYAMYGPMPDSTPVDVSGGWHDASDYLQYATTSANATYHLLMAYRDFPNVFTDQKLANGLDGKNRRADVLDEAKWGLDWLLKMHPKDDWMFNQIADDRDHIGFRIPKDDKQYGKGFERPVYFINGEPQGLFKYKNRTKGTSSTAGKFASAFALGAKLFYSYEPDYSRNLDYKSSSSLRYAKRKLGVTQTAPGRAPYFYEEDNWTDDLQLANVKIYAVGKFFDSIQIEIAKLPNTAPPPPPRPIDHLINDAIILAKKEQVTPWLGADTAKHYQWYPFINLGHYELAKQLKGKQRDTIISYYKTGIQRVWNKAQQNAFYRGIPFIWCSNNLTTSFAIQCYWYKKLTADQQFSELEQANFDWLFGCNPWGTSMVYGLPSHADTPTDPHSAFTKLKNYPIDGGLVDGPVYGSIYNNLIGITIYNGDEYAEFQSDLAVYHDDYGDYSTNEPTMDGTASLIYLLAAKEHEASAKKQRVYKGDYTIDHGGIIRGDSTRKELAIVFTGDEFNDGGKFIHQTLQKQKTPASFFLTGNFYKNPGNEILLKQLVSAGHFVGNHSLGHLLYAPWTNRNTLLVNKDQFTEDLTGVDAFLKKLGIESNSKYFLPPYEWYNDSISTWTKELNRQLINYTPGTLSHADYTTPAEKNYRSSDDIFQTIINYENKSASGLNGFILLMHIGTDPKRTDKFYHRLPQLIEWMKKKGYKMVRVDELLD